MRGRTLFNSNAAGDVEVDSIKRPISTTYTAYTHIAPSSSSTLLQPIPRLAPAGEALESMEQQTTCARAIGKPRHTSPASQLRERHTESADTDQQEDHNAVEWADRANLDCCRFRPGKDRWSRKDDQQDTQQCCQSCKVCGQQHAVSIQEYRLRLLRAYGVRVVTRTTQPRKSNHLSRDSDANATQQGAQSIEMGQRRPRQSLDYSLDSPIRSAHQCAQQQGRGSIKPSLHAPVVIQPQSHIPRLSTSHFSDVPAATQPEAHLPHQSTIYCSRTPMATKHQPHVPRRSTSHCSRIPMATNPQPHAPQESTLLWSHIADLDDSKPQISLRGKIKLPLRVDNHSEGVARGETVSDSAGASQLPMLSRRAGQMEKTRTSNHNRNTAPSHTGTSPADERLQAMMRLYDIMRCKVAR